MGGEAILAWTCSYTFKLIFNEAFIMHSLQVKAQTSTNNCWSHGKKAMDTSEHML